MCISDWCYLFIACFAATVVLVMSVHCFNMCINNFIISFNIMLGKLYMLDSYHVKCFPVIV